MPRKAVMDPMFINAEVTATAVVLTEQDPEHPDYYPEEKDED